MERGSPLALRMADRRPANNIVTRYKAIWRVWGFVRRFLAWSDRMHNIWCSSHLWVFARVFVESRKIRSSVDIQRRTKAARNTPIRRKARNEIRIRLGRPMNDLVWNLT